MKDLVVSLGSRLLDIIFIISCVFVVIGGIGMWYNIGGFLGFIAALITIVGGFFFLVISFFIIYIIVDIRDKLTQISLKP